MAERDFMREKSLSQPPLHIQDVQTQCPMGEKNCAVTEKIEQLSAEITRLQAQSTTDHLSGLFNHRHMVTSLQQELERSTRTYQPTTFIMIDIDHFKSVNDTYGHTIGDKALKHVADIIQENVRKIDIPCRYGGEEFAIILPSTPVLLGVQVAERIRTNIEKARIKLKKDEILKITASFGVNSFLRKVSTNGTIDIESFIAETDVQLYEAKHLGRNRVCHATHVLADMSQVSNDEKDALFELLKKE